MRVLVTLDGSALSEHALAAIAPWARTAGADVVLLTVLDPDQYRSTPGGGEYLKPIPPPAVTIGFAMRGVPVEPKPVPVEDRTQALERARVEAEEALEGKAAELLQGVACEVHVEWSGDAAGAIAHFAESHRIDLVAMGTHGRSGMGQALLGSVVASVIRQSPVPVLVVREGMRGAAGV